MEESLSINLILINSFSDNAERKYVLRGFSILDERTEKSKKCSIGMSTLRTYRLATNTYIHYIFSSKG